MDIRVINLDRSADRLLTFETLNTHPNLKFLRFPAIDGTNLKSLWEVRDLYDGKISFGKDRVVIRFLKEEEYVAEAAHGRRPSRHQNVYAIRPTGLDLQSEQDIPF